MINFLTIDKNNLVKESGEFWCLLVLCSFFLPDTDFIILSHILSPKILILIHTEILKGNLLKGSHKE